MKVLFAIFMTITMIMLPAPVEAESGDIYAFHNFYTDHPNSDGWKHEGKRRDYQEDNNVTGLRYVVNENWSIGAGTGRNSYDKEAYLLAAEWRYAVHDYVDVGVDFIAATGYEDHGGWKVTPAPMQFIRVGTDDVKVKLGMFGLGEVIQVMAEVRLYSQR